MTLEKCKCWIWRVSSWGSFHLSVQPHKVTTLRFGSLAWYQQQLCKSQPQGAPLVIPAAPWISRPFEPTCYRIPCPGVYKWCAEKRQGLWYLCCWLHCHCGSLISAWLWAFQMSARLLLCTCHSCSCICRIWAGLCEPCEQEECRTPGSHCKNRVCPPAVV